MFLRLEGSLLLAAFAAADLASIQGVLDTINAGLLSLDNAVIGLPETAEALTNLGAQVVPVLQNATQIIQQSAPLTVEEAQSLNASTAALRQNSNLTINDFVAQRAFFDASNLTPLILQSLAEDKAASVALGEALISKLPDASQLPGGEEGVNATVMELIAIYDRGMALFADPAAAAGVGPAPTANPPPSPSDLAPVFLPVPQPADVESNTGTLNADGSCNCAVQCPAASFGMSAMMQMTGVMGTTGAGASAAPALQMLPGSSSTGSGTSAAPAAPAVPALQMLPGSSSAGSGMSAAPALQMLPGSSSAGSGMPALKPLGGQ